MTDRDPKTQRYYENRVLAAQVYIQAADKVGSAVPDQIRSYATENIPSKFTGLTHPQAVQYLADLREQNKRLDDLNERLSQMHRDSLKNRIDRGEEVSSDQLRLAKATRHDLEMEIKLDKIQEDPEKYFQEARKKARAVVEKEMRDEALRPFKKALDWILRRR